jgi:hypothetical protein
VFAGSASVRRVLELATGEAARFGHRYLGPEHLLLGMLRDGGSPPAAILRTQGMELEAARAALGRLAERGVVPSPRPSDAELLGSLGIDLEAVRRSTERTFGAQAVGRAMREATRARRRGVGRVPRTPLEEPPLAVFGLLAALVTWSAPGMGPSGRRSITTISSAMKRTWRARPNTRGRIRITRE